MLFTYLDFKFWKQCPLILNRYRNIGSKFPGALVLVHDKGQCGGKVI